MTTNKTLDLIAIGRSSVDLYGAQVGGRLEDMASFSKAVGGCPTNIAIGTARLGLRSGLITRVGDEHMGRFIREQLAGDLLPAPSDEQRIATGFHRNSLKNDEAGADLELDRTKAAVDRTATTGAVWLGLTVGCAECHTHKYDPITAKDFYSLAAFFGDVQQWGVYADYNYTPNTTVEEGVAAFVEWYQSYYKTNEGEQVS